MRIAIVGAGISGLGCAWLLSREHEVTLFEANDYLGGHTHTHAIEHEGERYAIDTGFIVFSPEHYPLLTRLLEELRVPTQRTSMSFSVRSEASGLEYNAGTLAGLFCQPRNLISARFLGMLRDLVRFYREAPALLHVSGAGPSLGEYLTAGGYGSAFRDEHLLPMAGALWSAPPARILSFPAQYLVRFMAHHHMLQVRGRAAWRVISGGSARYVDALRARWRVQERTACAVHAVRRDSQGVELVSRAGRERFDQLVLACHSDQALGLLSDASVGERDVLGALTYQTNDVVLHTDARLLPRNRRAWAAWNAYIPAAPQEQCTVSYCMNLLQGVRSRAPFVVSLNRSAAIDPARVLASMRYQHPLYTHAAVQAQSRRAEIQGHNRTWFAGAYWGWGFHEDGLRSALEVSRALGVRWGGAPADARECFPGERITAGALT